MTRDASLVLRVLGLFLAGIVLSALLAAIAMRFDVVLPDRLTNVALLLPLGLAGAESLRRWVLAQLVFRRGLRLFEAARHVEALTQFERACELNQHVDANIMAAETEIILTRFGEALDRLEAALESDELASRARAFLLRAFCYAVLNRMRDPLADVVVRVETGFIVLIRAIAAIHAGEWTEAEAQLARPELRQLGGFFRGLADALMAWVAHTLRGESRELNKLRIFGESGDEGLRRAWPQLMAFIDASR